MVDAELDRQAQGREGGVAIAVQALQLHRAVTDPGDGAAGEQTGARRARSAGGRRLVAGGVLLEGMGIPSRAMMGKTEDPPLHRQYHYRRCLRFESVDPPRRPGTPPAGTPGTGRPIRAHARRNREKLIAAARAAFAAADDTVPLEGIARDAGVGIGTLYRHFPTREALVEAVYGAELDDIVGSVPALLDQLPPDAALRTWMNRYAAFISAKRGMFDILRAGWASGRIATPTTRARITAAIAAIIGKGADAGSLRADVDPDDVTTMLLGIFLSTTAGNTPEQTGRLLDLVVDALRPKGEASGLAGPSHPGRGAVSPLTAGAREAVISSTNKL
ncbi:hypothetical protein GCM10020295_03330 [Streptomyces cinereospinus]